MFNEKNEKVIIDTNVNGVRVSDKEVFKNRAVGEFFDYAIYKDGTRKLLNHDNNLIVDECSVLIATLFKSQAGYTGVQYWAVGEGSDTWNDETPPSPLAGDGQLLAETFRKSIVTASVVFINSSNVVSATPTNRIQITVLFGTTEANGPLREFAIFGGNATATANSGLMINRKIHPLIYKTNEIELERIIRFTF